MSYEIELNALFSFGNIVYRIHSFYLSTISNSSQSKKSQFKLHDQLWFLDTQNSDIGKHYLFT